jgi:hypothetical protein
MLPCVCDVVIGNILESQHAQIGLIVQKVYLWEKHAFVRRSKNNSVL